MTPPRSPRRILMTADAVGGVWTYALTLAQGLAAYRIETVLAVMGPRPSPAQRRDAQACPALRVIESDYRLEWMDGGLDDFARAEDWLMELAWRHSPDAVHLNGYGHGAAPWPAPCLVVAHSCVASWWAATRSDALPASWAPYLALIRRGLEAADMVVAPTTAFLEEIRRLHGVRGRMRAIPNGRDGASFAPDFKQPFVLAAGRPWDEAKNVAALDAVAGRIDWPILVAGDTVTPTGDRVRCSRIRLLGRLPAAELAELMGRASIFAAPARYEPFGLAVLEAALSGCALVLGDIPSQHELWHDAAIFVPPDDHDALASALSALGRDRARVRAFGQRALRRARSYTVDRMAADYLSAYRALAGRASGRAARRGHAADRPA